ncbi:MAG: hypothetical protein ACHQAX_00820 [Gammaproteobacteria bacterium]
MKNNACKIVAAILSQHADVTLNDVNMNPAHSGFLRYAILMGARIHILDQRWIDDEPVSNLRVQHAKQLQAIEIRDEHLSTLEAELPLLYLMATCAKGTSTFPDHPSCRGEAFTALFGDEEEGEKGQVSPYSKYAKRIVIGDPALLPLLRSHLKEILNV